MKRYAIVIGINNYIDSPLKQAVYDAEKIYKILETHFDKITLLKDENATIKRIIYEIDWLKNYYLKENDIFMLYFSGHGVEINDSPCIHMYDGIIHNSDIRRHTNLQGVKRLFIFDCCRSEILINKNINHIISDTLPDNIPGIFPPVIYNACNSGQFARENSGGEFTNKVVNVLQDISIKSFAEFQYKLQKHSSLLQDFNFSIYPNADIPLLQNWKLKYPYEKPKEYGNEIDYDALFNMCLKDNKNALQILENASATDNIFAQEYLIKFYLAKEDMQKAIYWIKRNSSANSWYGKFLLAICYEEGIDDLLQKDLKKSFSYYDAAYKLYPSSDCAYKIGLFYKKGIGISKDVQKGFTWLKIAADNENKDAMRELALCYKNGIGCTKDLVMANKYLLAASIKNDTDSMKILVETNLDYMQKQIFNLAKKHPVVKLINKFFK